MKIFGITDIIDFINNATLIKEQYLLADCIQVCNENYCIYIWIGQFNQVTDHRGVNIQLNDGDIEEIKRAISLWKLLHI